MPNSFDFSQIPVFSKIQTNAGQVNSFPGPIGIPPPLAPRPAQKPSGTLRPDQYDGVHGCQDSTKPGQTQGPKADPCQGQSSCDALPTRDEVRSLKVPVAIAGNFEAAPTRLDPLVLMFKDVVPGAKIYWLNRSRLDQKALDRQTLPGDTAQFTTTEGSYNIVLSTDWMRTNDVKPGDVLEFCQSKGGHTSKATVVAVNGANVWPVSGNRIQTPALPPGDRIGVTQVLPFFALEFDGRIPELRPARLRHQMQGPQLVLTGGALALEPGARVMLQNLTTNATVGPIATVKEDGTFSVAIDATKYDPILVRVIDHSNAWDATGKARYPLAERRLTLVPCIPGSEPVLAAHPALGVDGAPQIAAAQVSVHKVGCGKELSTQLVGDRAVTPGSIVEVKNFATGETKVAVADQHGSFALPPEDLKADDVLELQVRNPFTGTAEVGTACQSRARIVVNKDCTVDVDPAASDMGRVIGQAVEASKNEDSVKSLIGREKPLSPVLTNLSCGGTGLSFNWKLAVDVRCGTVEIQATPTVDKAAKQIIVTVDCKARGGYVEPKPAGTGGANGWMSVPNAVTSDMATPNVGEVVTYDFILKDTTGEVLATAKADVKKTCNTSFSSSYDGRGGILPLGSIPRATAYTSYGVAATFRDLKLEP